MDGAERRLRRGRRSPRRRRRSRGSRRGSPPGRGRRTPRCRRPPRRHGRCPSRTTAPLSASSGSPSAAAARARARPKGRSASRAARAARCRPRPRGEGRSARRSSQQLPDLRGRVGRELADRGQPRLRDAALGPPHADDGERAALLAEHRRRGAVERLLELADADGVAVLPGGGELALERRAVGDGGRGEAFEPLAEQPVALARGRGRRGTPCRSTLRAAARGGRASSAPGSAADRPGRRRRGGRPSRARGSPPRLSRARAARAPAGRGARSSRARPTPRCAGSRSRRCSAG